MQRLSAYIAVVNIECLQRNRTIGLKVSFDVVRRISHRILLDYRNRYTFVKFFGTPDLLEHRSTCSVYKNR